jgi:hypothetical protein
MQALVYPACGGQLLQSGASPLSTRTVVINQASTEIVGSESQYTIVFSVCWRRSWNGSFLVHTMALATTIVPWYTVLGNVGWKLIFKFLFIHGPRSIYLGGSRDPMCMTKRSSHVSDLVHTSCCWGVYQLPIYYINRPLSLTAVASIV